MTLKPEGLQVRNHSKTQTAPQSFSCKCEKIEIKKEMDEFGLYF